MKPLAPLARLLARSLRRLLFRRALAWAACAAMMLALGEVLAPGRVYRLGLTLSALSALPVFLLWPLPERFLLERLRRLDEEMVFEALLEAEPGPTRDLLRRFAAQRASALGLLPLPREPLLAGLGRLLAATVVCLVLAETGSRFFRGRSLASGQAPAQAQGAGVRLEEEAFSDYATEDPAARQARSERLGAGQGESAAPSGDAIASREGAATAGKGEARGGLASMGEKLAKRKQGDLEGLGPARGEGPTPASAPRPGEGRRTEDSGAPQGGSLPKAGPGTQGPAPVPGRSNQGYEHTADTKVPSPLQDYRSRLESRFAERTGTHVAAQGQLGFGELRAFQRRYFESFQLHTDVGGAEDPYVLLLKKRWSELKGGLR